MTEQNAEFGQGILTPWVLKTYTKYKVTLACHSDVLLFPERQTMQGWQKEILLNKFCIKFFIAFNNLLLCFIFFSGDAPMHALQNAHAAQLYRFLSEVFKG